MTPNASKAVVTLTFLALLVTAYYLSHVVSLLLLFFADMVLAVLLDAIAGAAQRVLPGGRNVGLVATALIVLLVLIGAALLIVPPVVRQAPQLVESLPEAWATVRARLEHHNLLEPLIQELGPPSQWLQGTGMVGRISGILSSTFDVIFNIVVIGFIGLYLAVSPKTHWRVLLYPLRPEQEAAARRLLAEAGRELRHWLAGRGISMVTVGVATGLGLWLLGVQLAFTLGLLTGVLSFVPYLGPIIAAVPTLLIAFSQSTTLGGLAAVLYLVIQTLESYVLTPLVQQRAVALPPAWLLIAQILGGVFAGALGVVFAAPVAVTGATAVRVLYVEPREGDGAKA